MDREIILQAAEETGKIITVEDHNITGGLGSAVAEVVAESGSGVAFRRMGLRGFSNGYGSYAEVKEMNGIGKGQILKEVKTMLEGLI